MVMKILIGKGPQGSSYANWSKDPKHRKQAKLLNVYESVWPENGGPLPWRLTTADKKELDLRMRNVVWPHYFERLYYKGTKIFFIYIPTHYEINCGPLILHRYVRVEGAKPHVEKSKEVPTTLFHIGNTTQGESEKSPRRAVTFCLGHEAIRRPSAQFRASHVSWDSARITINCQRWFRWDATLNGAQSCLVRRCHPTFVSEAWSETFRSLCPVYHDTRPAG